MVGSGTVEEISQPAHTKRTFMFFMQINEQVKLTKLDNPLLTQVANKSKTNIIMGAMDPVDSYRLINSAIVLSAAGELNFLNTFIDSSTC